jgi:hypothetical protein
MPSLIALLLAGCAANVPQLQQLRSLLPPSAAQRKAADYGWLLQFNGTRIVVYPVRTEGRRVLFAGENGAQVLFNGDFIERVEGLPGAAGKLEVAVDGATQWYRNGWTAQPLKLECLPVQRWRLTTARMGTRIECRSGQSAERRLYAIHQVERDPEGIIRRIESTLVPGAAPMVLTPLKFTGQSD